MGIRAWIAASAVAFALPASGGNPPKAPTPQQNQQAGDLVKKAIAKSQAGDHVLAIELYQQAYNIVPNALLLSNIGSEYQQAQKPVEAIKYFCKYLQEDPTGSNATYAAAQAKSLQITVQPPGTQIDDKDPCHPITKPVVVTPPVVGVGSASPSAGSGSDPQVTGTAEFGASGTTTSAPPKAGRGLMWAGVGVAAVGVVSLIVGIDFALKSKSLNDQINPKTADNPNGHDQGSAWPAQIDGVPIDQWKTQGEAWNRDAYIFTIVGGVATVAGGAMFFIGRSKGHETPAEHVQVVPHHDGAAVVLTGRF
jgi:hypothetical protein